MTKLKKYWKVVDNSRIYHTYYHKPIDDRLVFVESRNGRDIAGNILRLTLEIKKQFGDRFKICTAAREESMAHVKSILKAYSLDDIKVYKYESAAHYICLEKAHYLINDTTFTEKYVKRDGQIYLNTWHGTPYKCMGIDSASDMNLMENVQRNLMMADYLLYPSRYCAEKMTEGYSVDGLYPGIILDEGYPRNSVFFDDTMRGKTRERFAFNDKKVYMYMPTYRESNAVHQDEKQIQQLYEFFKYIDDALNDDELFIVKLHYYVQEQMDFDEFKKIKVFPSGVETYEFLAACDCLITDYSSVFYDYANSGRKIIRFIYDEDEYMQSRGTYEQPVDFPFPAVKTVEELLREMRSLKDYDDRAFLDAFCTYDNKDASERIIRHVFKSEKICSERKIHDGKEHVVIYAGGLALNGITKSLQNIMALVDDGREYYICFCRKILSYPQNIQNLTNLPKRKKVYSINGAVHKTLSETLANYLFYKKQKNSKWIHKQRMKIYTREVRRSFYNTDFSTFIQFGGYDWEVIEIFGRANAKRCIFVHNDMVKEVNEKGNQHFSNLKDAYSFYDKVAVVAEQLIEPTSSISGRSDNIVVVENCQNFDQIKENSLKLIEPDVETEIICEDTDDIDSFIKKHDIKIATIGRFSKEKRHDRLIEAFESFHDEHPSSALIIIGGYGEQFDDTIELAASSRAHEDIMIIKSIKNPMAVLKQSDLFVLSSDYEGLPLVLLEADAVGIPCIATDIPSVADFMRKYKGKVVERSVEGILEGMKMFMRGELGLLDIDYESYNRQRIEQFEELFN